MKYVKHFFKVGVQLFKRSSCSHRDVREAACPYTQRIYTTCNRCGERIAARPSNNEY
jgi:hypothetical protein